MPAADQGPGPGHRHPAAAFQLDGVGTGFLEEPDPGADRLLVADLVGTERQVDHQQRGPDRAPGGPRQHQHLLDGHRHGVGMTEHRHRTGVADQHDVHPGGFGGRSARVVVGGDHDDRPAGPLVLEQVRDGDRAAGGGTGGGLRVAAHRSVRTTLSISRTAPTRAATNSRAAPLHPLDRVETALVDECEVVRGDVGPAQFVAGDGQQRRGVPLTRAVGRARGEQRPAQRDRAQPLVGPEPDIAARQRQPVRLAHRGYRHHLDIDVQVGHHRLDHPELLGVLLTEVGAVGADHVQQFGHHGGDTGEVPGPTFGTLQRFDQRPVQRDGGGETGGVDLRHRGQEHQLHPGRPGQLQVTRARRGGRRRGRRHRRTAPG